MFVLLYAIASHYSNVVKFESEKYNRESIDKFYTNVTSSDGKFTFVKHAILKKYTTGIYCLEYSQGSFNW